MNPNTHTTLVDLLRWRATQQPDRRAYTFLVDGETTEDVWTYSDLDRRARTIATELQALDAEGERVLLLYPQGMELVAAFLGCLYAGAVAMPAYPPRDGALSPAIQAMVGNAGATFALTVGPAKAALEPQLTTLHWLSTPDIAAGKAAHWRPPAITGGSLAFLQYTSGSTGDPKGVMLTHANLLANEQMIAEAFGHSEATIVGGWLPLFHNTGLIGNLLQSLYLGVHCVLMSPVAFLQKPLRWLTMITRYGITTSGGPNFAYDLCVRRTAPEERATLDLSSWNVAFNGSEPVRAATLDRFAKTFAPCGFRREALYPSYGLAEASLFVAGGFHTEPPVVAHVDGAELARDGVVPVSPDHAQARSLVGCGRTWQQQEIVIVDPQTLTPCAPHRVGEIWIAGPNVAQGYWSRPAATAATFGAHLASGEGPYLRTGDLGFLQDGELFITGRLKDLIIIRGRNHYPQDIEATVARCHPAVLPGSGAAFSIDVDGEERLVVAQEVNPEALDARAVVDALRGAVSLQHNLQVYTVALLAPQTLPKTASGKVRRRACRAAFLEDQLPTLAKDVLARAQGTVPATPVPDRDEIAERVLDVIRSALVMGQGEREALTLATSFRTDLAVDSLDIVELTVALEDAFNVTIGDDCMARIDTVEDLAAVIRNALALDGAPGKAAQPPGAKKAPITPTSARGQMLPSLALALERIPQVHVEVIDQEDRVLYVDGHNGHKRTICDFASCNYLGLDLHDEVKAAIPGAVERWGVHPSWTRAVASPQIYLDLERDIADLIGAPTVLVFSCVSLLHFGVLPMLAGQNDVILMDNAAHHSIYEAARLARQGGARFEQFPHGDVDALAKRLARYPASSRKVIAVDGVYSMAGTLPDLPALASVAKEHEATLYVDDAHGLGVVGESPTKAMPYGHGGRGIVRHFGLDYVEDNIVYVAGLSKAFSSFGAFVTCKNEDVKGWLSSASTMVFSGPSPVASLASARAGLGINRREGDERRAKMYQLTRALVDGAREMGFKVDNESYFPIASVVIGTPESLVEACEILWEHGILITPAIFPAVPLNRSAVRFSITAANTKAQVERALDALRAVQERSIL